MEEMVRLMSTDWRRDVYTVAEAARKLHVSEPTLRRMLKEEIILPAAKKYGAGRGITVIPKTEIEHYIVSLRTAARRAITNGDNNGDGDNGS